MYIYIYRCVLAADRQFYFENFLEKIFELGFGNGTIGFTRVHSIDSKVEQKKIYFWRFLTEPLREKLSTAIHDKVVDLKMDRSNSTYGL